MSSIVVRAEKMAAGGDAIARMADGRVAFVRGALPGESVAVQVVQSKKDFVRAEVVDVLEPSLDRTQPPCPAHARGCGGCSWQHVSPHAQLALKTAIVIEALQRTGKLIDPVVHVGAAVEPWAYRTTLRLAAGAQGRLGLRSRSSHDVVALDACPVSHPRLDELLDVVRVTGVGEVSLRVGAATGERSVWTIDDGLTLSGLPDDVAVGPDAVVHEVVAGVRLQVSAASFFQSGPAAAELLVTSVRAASGELADGGVIDVYGGVGLFASTVTSAAVTVVEGSESACTDAAVNLSERRATIVHSAVERWQPTRADLVIADPSRSGLGRGSVTVLAGTEAKRIVLVSCDPVSLARDAGLLRECGYEHVASTVYDLFPNTHHVEVVTAFDRAST